MSKIRTLAVLAVMAIALAACSGGAAGPSRPSVAACTKAYPAWFAASALHKATAPTPPACKGLTSSQVTAIAVKYLESLS
jgi:hypothetical protein